MIKTEPNQPPANSAFQAELAHLERLGKKPENNNPMNKLDRRSFLQQALASISLPLLGAAPLSAAAASAVRVASGEDREGVPPRGQRGGTTFKVLTHETNGGLFVMEQLHKSKGMGPDRHLHHEQDELFFVIEGEYIAEIGSNRVRLKAGDSILGPRGIPHAYLFVGTTPGRMLISYAPAGKMEAYFRSFSAAGRVAPTDNSPEAVTKRKAENYAAYGMQYIGPPLTIE